MPDTEGKVYVMFIKMEQEADFTTWTQLAKVRPWHGTSSPCTDLGIARKHLAVFLEVEVCCPDQAALPSLLPLGEGGVVALPSLGDTGALHLSPGPDASPSLLSPLVPPHLGPGRPREPQGAVAALPQEKPLPGRGGPCLPLLVSIGDAATW